MIQKNDLYDYDSRYIFQDSEAFKFSLDSILLAEFCNNIPNGSKVVDLCAGNMAIPLILSTYNNADYYGFEINREIFNLGIQSININKLNHRMHLINDDVLNIFNYFPNHYFDYVVCNPPYFKKEDSSLVNKNEAKRIARHEIYIKLEDIFSVSKKILNDNGRLYLVHRSNRLDEIIYYASKYDLAVKKIQLVSTKVKAKPTLLLVECVKHAKTGVTINSELCIENVKTYKNIFREK